MVKAFDGRVGDALAGTPLGLLFDHRYANRPLFYVFFVARCVLFFIFASEAKQRFGTGSIVDKRKILVALGSNLVLKDRILQISLQEPFEIIAEGLRAAPAAAARFEPREFCLPEHETSGRGTADSVWWT